MFADSLCEASWNDRSRRGWMTLISFAIQATAVAILLAIPLVYTEAVPQLQHLTESLTLTPPPGPPPAPAGPTTNRPPTSNLNTDGAMITPPSIPPTVADIHDDGPPAAVDVHGLSVLGGTGTAGSRNSVWGGTGLNATVRPPDVATTDVVHRLATSRIMEGNLIRRVQPIYPKIAIDSHTQGTVVLQAIISKNGTIENLQLLSGHPMLVKAAMDAVRQWRYRPYYLNDQPVEVETQVIVKFVLAGG